MSELITKANIARPDDFYAELIGLHEGRSKEDSDALNARLILLLANHIGDMGILRQAMKAAAKTVQAGND
ncbi:MAG: DUF2783 domain-containing protein [Salaquimonas sp.]|jgi:hypothetical protein|nr:DUF2783 domain-containing protein [Salaquimonas sp.]